MYGRRGILTLRLNAPCSPQEVAVTDGELEVELAVEDDSVRRVGSMEMVGIKKDGATMPDGGAVAVEPVKVSIPADSMLDKNSAIELIFAGSTVVAVGIKKDGATRSDGASVIVDLIRQSGSLVSVALLGDSLQEERVTSGRRTVWAVESDTEISETMWENSEECDGLSAD